MGREFCYTLYTSAVTGIVTTFDTGTSTGAILLYKITFIVGPRITKKKYEDDFDFPSGIHKTAALAFTNPNAVVEAFVQLSIRLDDQFQSMLDYFEDNYIGRFRENGSHVYVPYLRLNTGMFMIERKIHK